MFIGVVWRRRRWLRFVTLDAPELVVKVVVTADVVGAYGSVAWDVIAAQYILFFAGYAMFREFINLLWFPTPICKRAGKANPLLGDQVRESKVHRLRIAADEAGATVIALVFGANVLLYAINSNCPPLNGVFHADFDNYSFVCDPNSISFVRGLLYVPLAVLLVLSVVGDRLCFNRTVSLWLVTIFNAGTIFCLLLMSAALSLFGAAGVGWQSPSCPVVSPLSVLLIVIGGAWILHLLLIPVVIVCGGLGCVGFILAGVVAVCCHVIINESSGGGANESA